MQIAWFDGSVAARRRKHPEYESETYNMARTKTINPVLAASAVATPADPMAAMMAQMAAMQEQFKAQMAAMQAQLEAAKAAKATPATPETRIETDDKGHVIIHGGTRGRFGLKLYPSDFDHLAKINADATLAKALKDAIAKARPIADARLKAAK